MTKEQGYKHVPITILDNNNTDIKLCQIKVALQGQHNTLSMELRVTLRGKYTSAAAHTLLDCGVMGNLISKDYVKKHRIREHDIPMKIELLNADDSKNLITT